MPLYSDSQNLNSIGSRLRFLLHDIILYGGASVISKFFWIISFSLLARHFAVDEYGVIDYFIILSTLLVAFFVFGQDSAVARFFYQYESKEDRRQLISQSLVFQFGWIVILIPILLLFADQIIVYLIEVDDGVLFFSFVLLQAPFLLLINFAQNLLKWTFDRNRFLVMSLGYAIFQTSFLILGVLFFEINIAGVLLINLATSIIFSVVGLFFVREWLVRPRNLCFLNEMLPFAIPYGIICVLGVLSPVIQRTLTESQLGSESLGLYAAAVQISMVISLFAGSFQTAWGPFYLSIYKKSDAGHTYNLILKLFALAICVITLLLTILSQPLILVLASDKYIEALVIIFPLAMGLAIQSVSWITEIGIEISKKSYLNLYSQLFAVFVTICGILILGPWFNLFGIAMGVLLGIIAKVFTASWLAQRVYPLPWQYPPVILLIIVTFGFGMFSLLIAESFGKTYQISFLIFSIFVLLVIGLCKLFSRPERQFLLSLFRVRYGATK